MALTKIKTGSVSDSITLTTPTIDGVLTANGGAVFNEASADVDFRVESDGNANMLFVDGGNNAVGIGTSSPATALDARGGINSAHATFSGQAGRGLLLETEATTNNDDTVVYNAQTSTGQHSFETNGTKRMRIDSSGNVGIGIASPTATYGGSGTLDASGPLVSRGQLATHQTNAGVFQYGNNITSIRSYGASSGSGSFVFKTGGGGAEDTTRMRIDSAGTISSQYGTSTGYNQTSGSGGMNYQNDNGSTGGSLILSNNADRGWSNIYLNKFSWSSGDDVRFIQLAINGGVVGTISTTGTGTAYNTSSDYRLKENVVPMTGSIDRVKALKPSRFNFIVDADNTVDGFLAHEAQEVVPECVTGTKDAMKDEEYEVTAAVEEVRDADDNITTEAIEAVMGTRSVPDMQGIDQSKLVPLLVAALQEAIARIEILEGA